MLIVIVYNTSYSIFERENVIMTEIKRKLLEDYRDKITAYIARIIEAETLEKKIEILNALYRYVKKTCLKYYNQDPLLYDDIRRITRIIEDAESATRTRTSERFISDAHFKFNPSLDIKGLKNSTGHENILKYIVHMTRKAIFELRDFRYITKIIPYDEINLAGYCEFASNTVAEICARMNIPCRVVTIGPGFIDNMSPESYNGIHCFAIVTLDGLDYLVDVTYNQFFSYDDAFFNRLGVPGFSSCSPGLFMNLDENRSQTSNSVLHEGYIFLTDQVLKDYLDGFVLSFLNGHYYLETGDYSGEVECKPEDYWEFVKSERPVAFAVSNECLGISNIPISDPYYDFDEHMKNRHN